MAAYSVETGGNAGFSRNMYDSPNPVTNNTNPVFGDFSRIELGVNSRYTDRPTVTYKPMTGTPFRKGVISPLPLHNVIAGLESGVSAQFMFSLGVRSINGLHNAAVGIKGSIAVQQEFNRVAEILSHLQLLNALHLRLEPGGRERSGRYFVSFGGKNMSAEATSLIGELKRLLDLDPSVREYEVIGSSEPENRRQIAMQTYSLYQIMAFVASGFEHSIANMYFMALGIFAKGDAAVVAAAELAPEKLASVGLGGYLHNLIPVTLGNMVGGILFVAVAYYLVFQKNLENME